MLRGIVWQIALGAPFSRPFSNIEFLIHFGRPSALSWLPLAIFWLPFGTIWRTFALHFLVLERPSVILYIFYYISIKIV